MTPLGVASPRPPFTTREACALAGATTRQLDYWDRIGLVSPSVRPGRRGRSWGRLWSRRDVATLRVAVLLMVEHTGLNDDLWLRRRRLEALLQAVSGQPVERLADRFVVAEEGKQPVLVTFDEFAAWWRRRPPVGLVKVIPLSPLVEDLIEMAP